MPTRTPVDLTGYRYGYWTVIRPVRKPKGKVVYQCRCLCGHEGLVSRWSLVNGLSTRCRDCSDALKREKWASSKHNLIGHRFDDWLVIGYAGRNNRNRERMWLCRCICGETGTVPTANLRKGFSKRCRGCVEMDTAARRASNSLTWLMHRLGEQAGAEPVDLTGHRFGEWTVLFFSGYSRSGGRLWMCLCTCGRAVPVLRGMLRKGDSTRCRWCSSRLTAERKRKERAQQ